MKVVIGIDPGIRGGAAVLRDGKFVLASPLPIEAKAKKGNQIDCASLVQLLQGLRKVGSDPLTAEDIKQQVLLIAIEHVHAMPFQGVSSMFSLGDSFGCVRTAAYALHPLPVVEFVPPPTWKKFCRMTGKQKSYSVSRARTLYPECRSIIVHKKNDEGLAEALLIAHYAAKVLS